MNKLLLSALAAFLAVAGAVAPVAAEDVILVSTHTREFIGADAAQNGVLRSVPTPAQALVVDRIALDGAKMAFRAKNGNFVRAGVGPKTLLAAASSHIRGWETFEIEPLSASKFAIRSVQNGLYVSLGADGRLSASARDITSRETFSTRAPQVAAAPEPQRPGRPGRPGVEADDSDLAGRWAIHRVRTFDGSLTALPRELRRDSFVRIRDNGRMSASAGCNDISGTVRNRGDMVQFGDVAATKKLCLGEAGVYEMLLLIAFDHGRVVDSGADQLRFYDVHGDAVMVLRRN